MALRSPQLGGDDRDDDSGFTGREPVISGRGSSVLVERRYAYLAQNLGVLLRMMSPEQQLDFKQFSVRVALRYARQALPFYERIYPGDRRPHHAIAAAQRWLNYPDSTSSQHVRLVMNDAERAFFMALSDAWDRGVAQGNALVAASRAFSAAQIVTWRRAHGLDSVVRSMSNTPAQRRALLRAAYVILQRGQG